MRRCERVGFFRSYAKLFGGGKVFVQRVRARVSYTYIDLSGENLHWHVAEHNE